MKPPFRTTPPTAHGADIGHISISRQPNARWRIVVFNRAGNVTATHTDAPTPHDAVAMALPATSPARHPKPPPSPTKPTRTTPWQRLQMYLNASSLYTHTAVVVNQYAAKGCPYTGGPPAPGWFRIYCDDDSCMEVPDTVVLPFQNLADEMLALYNRSIDPEQSNPLNPIEAIAVAAFVAEGRPDADQMIKEAYCNPQNHLPPLV